MSYFSVDPLEDRVNRVMETVQEITNVFLDLLPEKILTESMIYFQRILPTLLEEEFKDKYFTKAKIATYYLALLNYRLGLLGNKISPKHITLVKERLRLGKGKALSIFKVKKAQNILFNLGFLKKTKAYTHSSLLFNKVCYVISRFSRHFPELSAHFSSLRKLSSEIILKYNFGPNTDLDDAALTVVVGLLPFVFRLTSYRVFWIFVEKEYSIADISSFRRKVYRWRRSVRKNFVISDKGVWKKSREESKSNGTRVAD